MLEQKTRMVKVTLKKYNFKAKKEPKQNKAATSICNYEVMSLTGLLIRPVN